MKRSTLAEAVDGSLTVVVAGENMHNTTLLQQRLEAVAAESEGQATQHLCLYKVYDNPTGRAATKGS